MCRTEDLGNGVLIKVSGFIYYVHYTTVYPCTATLHSIDLDKQLTTGADPKALLDSAAEQDKSDSFSSYTRVTVTRRPDGVRETPVSI